MTKEEKTHLLSIIEGIVAPVEIQENTFKPQPQNILAICLVLRSLVNAREPTP